MSIVRQSKFRHVYGSQVKHELCMSEIHVTEITWESLFCAVNTKYIAVIVKGAGGPFQVIPINKSGRVGKDYPFVDAHRAPCLEVVWNPFNDNVIASCSEDATAKVWLIPEKGLTHTLTEPVVELSGHQKRVNTIAWHPTANNILLTAGGENKLLMWNVGTGEALLEITGHPDQIWSISFSYDGSRFVTTCKDKQIRVIDSHSGEVISQGQGHEGVKPQRAIFLRDGRIFTTGFTKRSERLYSLRYQEKIDEPIIQEELDTSNGVLFPLYDEDTGLVYLAGKGDSTIRYYEVNNEAPFVHYINTYTTSEPQRGIGFMPKLGLKYKENECARVYKVTTKGIVDVIQFFVPRKSDLFQADLYPPTRSQVPPMTAEQFISGMDAPPNLTAVNPDAAVEAKPKIHVAKKANILASLQPTQVDMSRNSADSTPQRSPRPDESSGGRFDEMSHYQQQQQQQQQQHQQHQRMSSSRKQPVMDDDMGIVRVEQRRSTHDHEPPTSMASKQQVQLRSRSDRDNGVTQTAGQRRATAELERIRREQAREPDRDELMPPMPQSASHSPRHSISALGEPTTMDELLSDLHKMKAILRQHERRIRLLEDQLADKNMAETYGF